MAVLAVALVFVFTINLALCAILIFFIESSINANAISEIIMNF